MLIVLLIRGVTLPGAGIGIKFYLYPDLGRLADPQVPRRHTNTHKNKYCVLYVSGHQHVYLKFPLRDSVVFCPLLYEHTPGAGVLWFSAGEPSFCWVHLLSMKESGTTGIKRRAGTPLEL